MYKLLTLLPLILISPDRRDHTYYFPGVFTTPNAGVAWYARPRDQEDADKVGAYWWYNSSSFAHINTRNQAIPMARPGYMHLFKQHVDSGYNEFMLVGNEGESGPGAGDDLEPREMAAFVRKVKDFYPLAHLVCLNSYSIGYMLDVISLLPEGTCQAWGVHLTHLVGDTPVSEWLDGLCSDCEVWVTEVGWCSDDPDAYDRLYRLAYEADQDPRVKLVFAYTTTQGQPDCLNMLDLDGSLRPTGEAFRDAMGADRG